MRLDLFSHGDSVLLLGEGNFSFTKCLYSHNLPITITATCFDNGVKYEHQLENVEFLTRNKIPVFHDVDATKLHEHPIISSQRYSKIIFNFPHVGGKMKIQLNRRLIKKVCESSSHLLDNGGLLIISLCNGQGGTPADNPQRKWDDSWQATEMAAYGSFCLISVEPFDFNNFQSYTCTGYRSQDSHFNLKGALVHVFKKKLTPSRLIDDKSIIERLSLVAINGNSEILVPFYYSDLYLKTPLNNSRSPVCFFKNLLVEKFDCSVRIVNDKGVSVAVEGLKGVICKCSSKTRRLRSSALQVMDDIVKEFGNCCADGSVVLFPGMFFNSSLGQDFDMTPPISFQFVALGENVSLHCKNFLNDVVEIFKRHELCLYSKNDSQILENEKSISNCIFAAEWYYTDSNDIDNIIAHELHFQDGNIKMEAFIFYVDKLVELFFFTKSWKEFWSEDSFVSNDSQGVPILKQGLLYPLCYTFDVTLRYETEKGLMEDDVYETLRQSAVDMVKGVEMINEYNSCMGWSSKCFRITYESLNEPLNRSKALDIHTQLISKMLISALPVTIN